MFRHGLHLSRHFEFPQLLAEISESSRMSLDARRSLALSRQRRSRLSARGPRRAKASKSRIEIASDLARAGIVVVSGLARGIDSAAHAGALDGGGTTIAVLGTGIDACIRRRTRSCTSDIARERLAGHRVSAGRACRGCCTFRRRNRIISGLSKAVVVVEAREKSGSLITARLAGGSGPRRDGGARPDRRPAGTAAAMPC